MGLSYSILPLSVLQASRWAIDYLDSIETFGSLDYRAVSKASRYPSLEEVHLAINQTDILIDSVAESFEVSKGELQGRLITHLFGLRDFEQDYVDDLTVKFIEDNGANSPVTSILGIKSNPRILIKFTISLAKICRPFIILSPSNAYLVDAFSTYDGFMNDYKMK